MTLDLGTVRNIPDLFLARLAASPNAPAVSLWQPANKVLSGQALTPADLEKGQWKTLTWSEYAHRVRCIAAGLLSLGFKKGHRLALYAPKDLSWLLMDMATLCIGGVCIPIYEGTPFDQVVPILADSHAAFFYVRGQEAWEGALHRLHQLPDLHQAITQEPVRGDAENQIHLADLETRGLEGLKRTKMLGPEAREGDLLKHAAADLEGERDACIYFTSGTQGESLPVPIQHRQFVSQFRQLVTAFGNQFSDQDVALSMLPYSHIFGRVEWLCHIGFGSHGFIAENPRLLSTYLQKASPTVLFTVPLVLQRIRQRIHETVQGLSGFRKMVAEKSLALAEKESGSSSGLTGLLADRLVYKKIREVLGGKLQSIVAAGAPLGKDLGRFFQTLGIKVFEGYGLTETTGAASVSEGTAEGLGSVGKALPDCEIEIEKDGEILVRGPTVVKGYGYSSGDVGNIKPERFEDGWYQTGDFGVWDSQGRLVITGRKKDLIITAAGKNIAPEKLEARVKTNPLYEQVIVVGENKPYPVALLVLQKGHLQQILAEKGLPKEILDDINWHAHHSIKDLVQEDLNRVNAEFAPFEQIRKFVILPEELAPEKGELTYTLKPRRDQIAKNYQHLIEPLYDDF